MEQIPVELITQILELLPVKTLLRFRSISKSIGDLIDSPDFIKLHLNATCYDRIYRKLIFQEDPPLFGDLFGPHESNLFVFDIDDGFLEVFDINDFEPELQNLPFYKFFAHCNGLILLGEDLFSLGVWNPSTRKYKKFPVLPRTSDDEDDDDDRIIGLGFGYDSCSDDYKVLLIKLVDDEFDSMEFWILGLRSCCWRKIGSLYYDPHIIFREDLRNCFADGAFHFIYGRRVLAFDIAKETLSPVTLPNFDQVRTYPSRLQVLEGRLCIGYCVSSGVWNDPLSPDLLYYWEKRDLYVRKKKGVEFSWTKLLSTMSGPGYEDLLLGYSIEGDKIFMLDYKHCWLYEYDFKERRIQWIRTKHIYNPNVIFCIESLVPVDYPG